MHIISEHHFSVQSRDHQFRLVADSLLPYLVTQGNWVVRPLHLAGPIAKPEAFPGFRLRSPNVITENGEKLILTSFPFKSYQDQNNCMVFNPTLQPSAITFKSDLLIFDLETLEGEPAQAQGTLILGVALIQVRE